MNNNFLKKAVGLMTAAGMLVLTACGGSSSGEMSSVPTDSGKEAEETDGTVASETSSEQIVIRIGHTNAENSPYQYGCEKFTELLEEKTGGAVTTEIFPGGVLGSDAELLEQCQMGTMDAVMTGNADVAVFVPEATIFDLPYLFRDYEHAHAVLDSEIGKGVLSKLDNVGLKAYSFWENGFRSISSKKGPVTGIEDLKGLKMRTQSVPMFVDFWSSLGANPTPMSINEVYTAIQQGTIDAQENPLSTIYNNKYHEVATYISETNHYYAAAALVFSKQLIDSLPEEYQQAIQEAAEEAGVLEREFNEQANVECLQKMVDEGCTITYHDEIDNDAFNSAASDLRMKTAAELGAEEMLTRIETEF